MKEPAKSPLDLIRTLQFLSSADENKDLRSMDWLMRAKVVHIYPVVNTIT